MSILLKPESDVCISSFLTSLASDAIVGVGESCLIDSKIFVLFGGLLHNFRWVSLHSLGDSYFFSTNDVMDEGGVGLKLEMVRFNIENKQIPQKQNKKLESLYFCHLKISTADFVFPHITQRIDLLKFKYVHCSQVHFDCLLSFSITNTDFKLPKEEKKSSNFCFSH